MSKDGINVETSDEADAGVSLVVPTFESSLGFVLISSRKLATAALLLVCLSPYLASDNMI